ncbi:hypothetical protein KP696_33150 [Nocardia seriolae]|uniref:Low molecular weight antigen MTB12-like C-terminal domain-containing protein n=1 Tax=Nocardia seriolae TaxID=37332 RepID=A0A0B8MZX8_9NOCA|nr:hypothetical protein [Nocardia seriolae]APA99173.1 hypothetical protein NS506_05127 [Nocardia seriolae]MTJ63425.1 hypothetical protein [Nocardia seriolae]MTJ70175.1 hypothetical protein [Nocardia seriolae]MTJ88774.1 hypothetical protein [Nocardia seriolae]MTK32753.1 hypothetical protein [Nocardia seriolae]
MRNVTRTLRVSGRTLRVSVATVAALAAVTATLTGCSSDDKGSTSSNSATSTVAAAPAPTAESLQSVLTAFADPAEPAADKAKLVVDGDKRLGNIDTMNQGLAHYQVGFTVGEIKQDGTKADAKVSVTSPHGTMPDVPMTFQYSDRAWKLSDAGACTILGMARAACQ